MVLTETIEAEILRAIEGALDSKTAVDSTEIEETNETDLEQLVDSIVVDPDSEISSDNELKIDFSDIMDYSRLAEEFHFEQIHYGSIESDYLVSVAAEHEAKYKEWEEATEYLMEDSATMDEVEAQDTMQEVIYAAIFNTADVSFEKRKRLDTWIKFNQVEFGLYKANAAVRTEDVNYNVN